MARSDFKKFWREAQKLLRNPSLSKADVEDAIIECRQQGIEQPSPNNVADFLDPERQARLVARQAQIAVQEAVLIAQQAEKEDIKCRKDHIAKVVVCLRTEIERRQRIAFMAEVGEEVTKAVTEAEKAFEQERAIFEEEKLALQSKVAKLSADKKKLNGKLKVAQNRIKLLEEAEKSTQDKLNLVTRSSFSLQNVNLSNRLTFWNGIYDPCVQKIARDDTFIFRVFQEQVQRGTHPLTNTQLIPYIACYGGHHYHKLRDAFRRANFASYCQQTIEIIDWGCGQAIATCVLLDYLLEHNINANIAKITLIEPSQDAIQQGIEYLQKIVADCSLGNNLKHLTVRIDNITPQMIISDEKNSKIHLFSNILDVPSFKLEQLHQVICESQTGLNKFICVSPNHPNKSRLDFFRNRFSQPVVGEEFHETNNLDARVYNHVKRSSHTPGTWANNYKIDRYERQFTIVI